MNWVRFATFSLSAIVLTGCGPELVDGTEEGGSIARANGIADHDRAFALATSYCGKFGKVPRETGGDPFAATMTFACVKAWDTPKSKQSPQDG